MGRVLNRLILVIFVMIFGLASLLAMHFWTSDLWPFSKRYNRIQKVEDKKSFSRASNTTEIKVLHSSGAIRNKISRILTNSGGGGKKAESTAKAPTSQGIKKPGIILQWSHPWGLDFEPPFEGQVFGDCIITYNRSKHAEALAVVFHYAVVPKHYPLSRDPKQFFVWYAWENPWVVRWLEGHHLNEYDNGFFNWTMTYRRDSDVYAPYSLMSEVYRNLPKGKSVIDQLIAGKKRIAVWAVSECYNKKGGATRMRISNEIAKVIPSLERYGKCFGGQWPKSKMEQVVRESKFYLAFENTLHCRDYITEKLYRNGYQYGAVPVVWGTAKEDYFPVAPLHSYIHLEDFSSTTELAKYLLYLDSNDTAYREYFRWREDPKKTWDDHRAEIERRYPGVVTSDKHTRWYGNLCEQVTKGAPPKVIPSLRKVVFGNENPECADLS